MPRSSLYPSLLKSAAQTGLHLLWKVHVWVSELPSSRSTSLLQDLGCAVLSLHAVVQGNMCRVTLGHGGVQGGTVPREWLLHMSFREAEVAQHFQSSFSSKHLSRIHAWLGRIPHSSTSSAMVLSFLLQTLWHALTTNFVAFPLYTRPRSLLPSVPFQTV